MMSVEAREMAGRDEPSLDVQAIRRDFPILEQRIHDKPLVYLDNAATTQKPRQVIDAISHLYSSYYANIHRAVHRLSELSTTAYEQSRGKVQNLIHARSRREIVFVRGATEAINLVAQGWGRRNIKPGDEILLTTLEHHSNIVPWQRVRDEMGAVLRVVPIDERGDLDLDRFEAMLGDRTRLVAVSHIANAIGTVNPVARIVEMAHAMGAKVLVDGAQAVPHKGVDVQALGCDFYVFSGHKMYAPTGIGVLYGREERLEETDPYQLGGDMIRSVRFEQTTFNDLPFRFEAGTPNIEGAIGLGAAIDYVSAIGLQAIETHEHALIQAAIERLSHVPGVSLIATPRQQAAVISFNLDNVHPHDVGTILDREGVAIRTGHHCCQPLMEHFGVPATVRASFAMYNTLDEVDALCVALEKVSRVFS